MSYPVDEEKLELSRGTIDHTPYQEDYIRTNNIIQGLMEDMVNQLRKLGHEAEVVFAGNTPADGTRQDVMPQNERQPNAVELTPAKASDVMLVGAIQRVGAYGRVPDKTLTCDGHVP